MYKAKKAIFSYKNDTYKVEIQTIYHCVSKTHEKNVSQISGMA